MLQFNRQLWVFFLVIFGIAILGLLQNAGALSRIGTGFRPIMPDKFEGVVVPPTPDSNATDNAPSHSPLLLVSPERPVSLQFPASSIVPAYKATIAQSKEVWDAVASVSNPTFDSVIRPLGHDDNRISLNLAKYSVAQEVSTDKAVRDAGIRGAELLTEYLVNAWMREDVYRSVKAVYDAAPVLDPEDQRLLERIELDFRRNGLSLPKATQQKVKDLENQLGKLSNSFSENIADDNGHLWLTKAALDGVPSDLVESWEIRNTNGTNEYKMTFTYPDVFPTLQYASLESTRRSVWVSYENRVPQNVKLMVKAIKLRKELAQLMEYDNYANYVLEDRMVKNATVVHDFLEDLRQKVKVLALKDLDTLSKIKVAQGSDQPLKAWDHRWANRILKEQEYQFDNEKISEYFEMNHTVEQIFNIYETLFGYKFSEVSQGHALFDVWHQDVKQYAVYRSAGNTFVGWLYLDLFPRDGKFRHAAMMKISSPSVDENGKAHQSVQALVCNFSKATKTKPSLLKFDEVQTYFHELGHAIHELATQSRWSRFDIDGCERDFIEAPSQMLENWCYSKNVLKSISRHYETGQSLPSDLIESIQRSRKASRGLNTMGQLRYALFDQKLHTDYTGSTEADLTDWWIQTQEEIGLQDLKPERSHGESSFAHLMGGYQAGYYGYLWAESYAADMFVTRFEGHELDPVVGAEYRDTVLRPAGMKDAAQYIRQFLGREPNNEAFLKQRGAI